MRLPTKPICQLNDSDRMPEYYAPIPQVVLYHGSKQERQAIRSKRMPVGAWLHSLVYV